jgi:aspartate carbamoyltransferase catalytic subunit
MRHILTGAQFADKDLLKIIFARAGELEEADKAGKVPKLLKDKIVATVFYETSTRTRLSFESAALKLGAGVISITDPKTSSVSKGESLEDTIRMVGSYADVIALRHPNAGTAMVAAEVSSVPIINAGDGGNEHPTQALFDLYTIDRELGRLEDLHVTFGFDPLHSRTIRSLSRLLAMFPGNRFTFISPKSLAPAKDLLDELEKAGASFEIKTDMDKIGQSDVLYLNRLQEERFEDKKDFEKNRKLFVLKPEHLKQSKAIVLDPLPRIDEIDVAVDDLPNAKYFQQAQNGLYIRMALLLYVFGL